jgi:hypothetical protein
MYYFSPIRTIGAAIAAFEFKNLSIEANFEIFLTVSGEKE